ncbi:MAG TPA: T9SS type A sorting domain-containing protein [Paludibacter sp.]|nr:T9SS type A sorting domain-containing protein [Paludibacter sp.]
MKKIVGVLGFIVFFTITTGKLHAVESRQLVTEMDVYNNDTTFQYRYFYDSNFNKVLETKYYQKDNSWIRYSQTEWIYNEGKCILQRETVWKNGYWKIVHTIDYGYGNDKLVAETHKAYPMDEPVLSAKIEYVYSSNLLKEKNNYTATENNWIISSKTNYAYTNELNTDTATTDVFTAGNVTGQYRFIYGYNPDGSLGSSLFQDKRPDSSWVNLELTKWYYKPGTSSVISERTQKWNSELSQWENSRKTENQYNSEGKLTSESYLQWKSMYWENQSRYDYLYRNDGLQVKKVLSLPIYNKWREIVSINYSDFSVDRANLIESKFEFWGGNAGELVTSCIPFVFNDETVIIKGKQLAIRYADASDVTLFDAQLQGKYKVGAYPNPSKGMFYLNNAGSNIYEWSVCTLEGKVLKSVVPGMQTGIVDLTDLPKGIYILKIKTGGGACTQKLIKE